MSQSVILKKIGSPIRPERFIKVWNNSTGASSAAHVLGLKAVSARTRAHYYRKRGVKMKMFPKGRKSYNWLAYG